MIDQLPSIGLALGLIALALSGSGKRLEASETGALAEGVAAMESAHFEQAERSFMQQRQECHARGDRECEIKSLFYLGLNKQSQAELTVDKAESGKLLSEAALFYQEALKLDPVRGSVLNNLARVYAVLGHDPDARLLFEKAVTLKTPRQPFYHRNYAEFLFSHGEWQKAVDHYWKSLEGEPTDRNTQDAIFTIFKEHQPERLPDYLWFLLAKGQARRVEVLVDGLLEKELMAPETSGQDVERYLRIVAKSLAIQSYTPEEFEAGDTALLLRSLSTRPEIGEGANEILSLFKAQSSEVGAYRWWAVPGRAEVFRELALSIGEENRERGLLQEARQLWNLSVYLTADLDLPASRRLGDLAFATKQTNGVIGLANRNEELVMRASARGELASEIYEYSHDFGLLFSQMQLSGDEHTPASAIYQLARATKIDKRGGVVGSRESPPDIPAFDARIYSRLAAGYSNTGKPERARQTMFDLVEAYRSHGLSAEANALQAVLNSGPGRHRPLDRRREVLDDPPQSRDFTTQPPRPPQ